MSWFFTARARPVGTAVVSVVWLLAADPRVPGPVITAVNDSAVTSTPAAFLRVTLIVAAAAVADALVPGAFVALTVASTVADDVSPAFRIDVAETASIPWRLFYLGRSEKTMAYVTELLSKFGEKVVIVTKDSGQRLDVAQEITSAGPEVHVYCCGPERLMVAVEEALGESQISRCHVERFHPRAVESHEPDVDIEVYCQKSDVELIVPADESILMTLDFAGVEIEGDCMEGTCGSCETRVISGTVEHRDSILSADAQKNGDTMMICVSRARGRLVLDL